MPESSDARLQGLRGWLILVAIGLSLQPLVLVKTLADNLGAFVGLLVGSGILLYLFFTKKRFFPKAVIGFMVLSLVVVLADNAAVSAIPQARAQLGPREYKQIVRAVIAAAIWIPYFLRSKRVHATFVN